MRTTTAIALSAAAGIAAALMLALALGLALQAVAQPVPEAPAKPAGVTPAELDAALKASREQTLEALDRALLFEINTWQAAHHDQQIARDYESVLAAALVRLAEERGSPVPAEEAAKVAARVKDELERDRPKPLTSLAELETWAPPQSAYGDPQLPPLIGRALRWHAWRKSEK